MVSATKPEQVKTDELLSKLNSLTVKLQDIEKLRIGAGGSLIQQFTRSYLLIAVLQGKGMLTLGSTTTGIRAQGVYFCMPEQTFGISDAGQGLELVLLRFHLYREYNGSNKWLRGLKDEPLLDTLPELLITPAGRLEAMCGMIYSQWHSGEEPGGLRSQISFQELLFYITSSRSEVPDDSNAALLRTKQYMDEHYHENLNLLQLAAMTGLSRKYFVDLFKKNFGISAMDYITALRINRAKQLMTGTGDLLFRDIAALVGFNDEFYFSRKFKKEVGISPSAYLNSRRRKIAAYHASAIGQLLALKIIPYAAPLHPKWSGHYYQNYGEDIPVHLSAYRQGADWRANIALLNETRPDIIVCSEELAAKEIAGLEQIAPVYCGSSAVTGWREQFMAAAAYLGEEAEACSWLESYKRKVDAAKEKINEELNGRKVVVLKLLKQTLCLHSSPTMAEVLYGDLEVSPAYISTKGAVYNERVELEQVAEISPDYILLLVRQDSETLDQWKGIQRLPAWRDLQAVREQRVHLLPSDPWREYSPMAHERIVEAAAELFTGKSSM